MAGKRSRPDVAAFVLRLEPELLRLRRELLAGDYRPGPYRTFWVLDPKPRQISAAPFRDRVVHHALTAALEPIWERRFSPHSFACREGRGTHAALGTATAGVQRFRSCLRGDIRKYFASIDHRLLEEMLARVVKCRPTLALAASIIASSRGQEDFPWYFPGDDLFTPHGRRRGLPLGNQTSQFFANVYLNGFDQYVDRVGRPPVWARYVDDWVLFDDSKQRLAEIRASLQEQLDAVRLVMHPGKTRVHACREGVSFLGWRLFPNRTRLARQNVVHTQRRLRRLRVELQAGRVSWERVQQSVQAWIAHAAHGDTATLRHHLLSRYPFRPSVGQASRPVHEMA